MLSRIEDASLNASAPPQQRWLDGWLVRLSPGKAKRARCINALAPGRIPLPEKLGLCERAYRTAGLPMVLRITRFTQPPGLDDQLDALGFDRLDDTRVFVCANPTPSANGGLLPAGLHWRLLDAHELAEAVGALRGSPPGQRTAQAQRLALSPVPYQGLAICRDDDGGVLACGQFAIEAEIFGLYDVFTGEEARGQGLATLLCQHLLSLAGHAGGRIGYLQVDNDNHAAQRIYARLGFVEAYRYHYRQRPPA